MTINVSGTILGVLATVILAVISGAYIIGLQQGKNQRENWDDIERLGLPQLVTNLDHASSALGETLHRLDTVQSLAKKADRLTSDNTALSGQIATLKNRFDRLKREAGETQEYTLKQEDGLERFGGHDLTVNKAYITPEGIDVAELVIDGRRAENPAFLKEANPFEIRTGAQLANSVNGCVLSVSKIAPAGAENAPIGDLSPAAVTFAYHCSPSAR